MKNFPNCLFFVRTKKNTYCNINKHEISERSYRLFFDKMFRFGSSVIKQNLYPFSLKVINFMSLSLTLTFVSTTRKLNGIRFPTEVHIENEGNLYSAWSNQLKSGRRWMKSKKQIFSSLWNLFDILFPIKVNHKNEGNLYSACSNPTNVVLVIVLGIIKGKVAWYWQVSWLLRNH